MDSPGQHSPTPGDADHNGSMSDLSSFDDLGDEHRSLQDEWQEVEEQTIKPKSSPKKVLDAKINYSQFRIHILTWNIASAEPSVHDIESLFVPQESFLTSNVLEDVDIVVIGLQEAYPSVQGAVQASVPFVGKDPLVELFSEVLRDHGYSRLSASRLLGIVTIVFVKRPILCYICGMETNTTKTGMGGLFGNKGASTIRFSLCGKSLCFLNCHLVPHAENNARRLDELRDIFLEQRFSSEPYGLLDHDVLIFFGDLNFRLEGQSMECIIDKVKRGKEKELQEYDQLRLEQTSGKDLPSKLDLFMEMQLTFTPSYKYAVGSDLFDRKKRPPAWCDRILWRTHERCLPKLTDPEPQTMLQHHYYSIHMQPRISDHKAVCAGISVNVDLDNQIPTVVFNIMHEWQAEKTGVIAFEMAEGTNVSMWDWVGLFPENFISVDRDYFSWIYAPVRSKVAEKDKEYSRTLQPVQVPEAGRYLLIYKSYYYGKVIGMSPVFPIR